MLVQLVDSAELSIPVRPDFPWLKEGLTPAKERNPTSNLILYKVPIVFVTVVEPVASGIVAKLVMFSLGRCAERGVDCADQPPDVGRYLGHHHRRPFTGAMAVTFRGAAATCMDAGARGRSRPW
jgi:hypothetical protein